MWVGPGSRCPDQPAASLSQVPEPTPAPAAPVRWPQHRAHCSSRCLTNMRPSPHRLPVPCSAAPEPPSHPTRASPALSTWHILACTHCTVRCLVRMPPVWTAQGPPARPHFSYSSPASAHCAQPGAPWWPPASVSCQGAPCTRAQRLHPCMLASPHVLSCRGAHTGEATVAPAVLPEYCLHGELRAVRPLPL